MPKKSLFASLLTLALCVAAHAADPARADDILDLLRQAKDSTAPLPLLEKAKSELARFRAKPNVPAGGRKRAAVNNAAKDNKEKALDAIGEAIEEAKKPGGNVKPKIDHAIALAHRADDMKN